MNGSMSVSPETVANLSSEVQSIQDSFDAAYTKLYETLRSSIGQSGSGLIWWGETAGTTLNKANENEKLFQDVSRALAGASELLKNSSQRWDGR